MFDPKETNGRCILGSVIFPAHMRFAVNARTFDFSVKVSQQTENTSKYARVDVAVH